MAKVGGHVRRTEKPEEDETLPDAVFAFLFRLFPRARAPSDGGRRGGVLYAPNGRRECARRQTQILQGRLKKENGLAT